MTVQGSVIVISAPSGSGKTTLIERLLRSVPSLAFAVSHTTRQPRRGEKNGRDYVFVSEQEFRRMAAGDEFVEWAEVFGHFYGTSRRALHAAREAGWDALLDIDVQGHQQIKRRLPESVSIFILPPSFRELERRLRRRHANTPEDIERRLADARKEIERWPEYDYLVVNDRLGSATQALKAIVLAVRYRRDIQSERAREISKSFGG